MIVPARKKLLLPEHVNHQRRGIHVVETKPQTPVTCKLSEQS